MKNFIILFIILFPSGLWAQQAQVRSHYPQSAFVVGRLLPFQLVQGGAVSIVKVETLGGNSCSGFADPYIDDHFHLYCEKKETSVSLMVHYVNGTGAEGSIKTPNFQIFNLEEATPQKEGNP